MLSFVILYVIYSSSSTDSSRKSWCCRSRSCMWSISPVQPVPAVRSCCCGLRSCMWSIFPVQPVPAVRVDPVCNWNLVRVWTFNFLDWNEVNFKSIFGKFRIIRIIWNLFISIDFCDTIFQCADLLLPVFAFYFSSHILISLLLSIGFFGHLLYHLGYFLNDYITQFWSRSCFVLVLTPFCFLAPTFVKHLSTPR